jgi:hypothetical protein
MTTRPRAPRRRATKLTPEIQAEICRYLRAGNYVETAAVLAGIHKDTFYDWVKRGRRGQEPHAAFVLEVDRAMAHAEAREVARIVKAAEREWQAAAWRLERRYPQRWGRLVRQEVSGPEGGPLEVQSGVVVLPPESEDA